MEGSCHQHLREKHGLFTRQEWLEAFSKIWKLSPGAEKVDVVCKLGAILFARNGQTQLTETSSASQLEADQAKEIGLGLDDIQVNGPHRPCTDSTGDQLRRALAVVPTDFYQPQCWSCGDMGH